MCSRPRVTPARSVCVCVRTGTVFQKMEQGRGKGVHLRGERKPATREGTKDERQSAPPGRGGVRIKARDPHPVGPGLIGRVGPRGPG